MKKRAVFLDRDGTINEDVGYPGHFSQIRIYPYSYEAVRLLNSADFLTVIVTNQSGVGKGLFTENDLEDIHRRLRSSFARKKARFDGIYACPHDLNSPFARYRKDCSCRKPKPGMALQAEQDLRINLENSFMIGDKVEDILFGMNIKALPILVLTGFGRRSQRELKDRGVEPAYVARDLLDAAKWILHRENACPAPVSRRREPINREESG